MQGPTENERGSTHIVDILGRLTKGLAWRQPLVSVGSKWAELSFSFNCAWKFGGTKGMTGERGDSTWIEYSTSHTVRTEARGNEKGTHKNTQGREFQYLTEVEISYHTGQISDFLSNCLWPNLVCHILAHRWLYAHVILLDLNMNGTKCKPKRGRKNCETWHFIKESRMTEPWSYSFITQKRVHETIQKTECAYKT